MNVSPTGSGKVKVDNTIYQSYPAVISCTIGASVTLEAIPATGYQFGSWSGSISGSNNPVSLPMNADKSVTANFQAVTTTATIGDLVWEDTNANGVQDSGEAGVDNVTVNLYGSSWQLVNSNITSNGGRYIFSQIQPGSYYLEFIAPAGRTFSPKNMGGNPALDSDADGLGKTSLITLGAGQEDYSWDAGLHHASIIPLTPGWNLISLPCCFAEGEDVPEVLLQDVWSGLDVVWAYDACADLAERWSNLATSGPIGSLAEMRDGRGYWLLMHSSGVLSVIGPALPDLPQLAPIYEICEGWNLFGFKSDGPQRASDYLTGVPFGPIYGYANGSYYQVQGSDFLMPGSGYWIAALESGLVCPFSQIIGDITPLEAFNVIQTNQDDPHLVIIDVRTPAEYATGHIENAINIDYYSPDFATRLDSLERNEAYLIYCGIGGRSASARDMMAGLNFKQVYNMTGGILEWQTAGLPVFD